jgi:hypothetical protein
MQLSEFTQHLSFSQVAYRTSIEDKQICLQLVINLYQASAFEHACDDFAIKLIHLAAIGPNVKCPKLSHLSSNVRKGRNFRGKLPFIDNRFLFVIKASQIWLTKKRLTLKGSRNINFTE